MSNYDSSTGISYGVISPHSINQDCLSSLYDEGTDPYYENAKEEFTTTLKSIISNFMYENNVTLEDDEIDIDYYLDRWNNNYESCGDGQCDFKDSEYTLHISGDNFGIYVMRSPYYTYCRKCSPCAPGAGDLNNPLEIEEIEVLDTYDRAYCLGPDYFGDSEYDRMPYRVFRVDNDMEVI